MMSYAALIARLKLYRCAELGSSPSVLGRIWVHGSGTLRIGDRVRLDGSTAPIELYVTEGAILTIGDDVTIEGGTSIEVCHSVAIGNGCKIGPCCKVLDNNQHQLMNRREAPQSTPVVIEDGVTLERGAIILPGVRLREGTVVRSGMVVRGRTPAPSAMGEPADGAAVSSPDPHPNVVARFIQRLKSDPLKAIRSVAALTRGAVVLRHCEREGRVYAYGPVRIKNEGTIRLGKRVGFVPAMIPSELICHSGAEIRIGEGTNFSYTVIEAHQAVTIGKHCMFASRVRLADTSETASGPLTIGDDVWVAHGAVISPGVSVGSGSVISAGAVVTKDVPENSLAIGNPARCVSLSLFAAG